jgi:hypothetical protein
MAGSALTDQDDKFKKDFDGATYERKEDHARLFGQAKDIFNVMKDGMWRTLDEINTATNHPHASISAQLRHLRKHKFGSHVVSKRARGNRTSGYYEYQLLVNKNPIK